MFKDSKEYFAKENLNPTLSPPWPKIVVEIARQFDLINVRPKLSVRGSLKSWLSAFGDRQAAGCGGNPLVQMGFAPTGAKLGAKLAWGCFAVLSQTFSIQEVATNISPCGEENFAPMDRLWGIGALWPWAKPR